MNKHDVEYLLIGGTLAIAYGVPRVTKDIDLFLNPTVPNATLCLAALRELGMGTADLTTPEAVASTEVTIFKDFLRLDILTKVKGITFATAWQNKVLLSLADVRIPALHLNDLIKTKEAAGRAEDLQDIKVLALARKKDDE